MDKADKKVMITFRRLMGVLCILLPFCVVPGFLDMEENGKEFWYSISATFWSTSNIWMIGLLLMTSAVFICYALVGYKEFWDIFLCISMAISSACIVMFPCDCDKATAIAGVWRVPIATSNIIHCCSAGVLFFCFAMMIGLRFSKGNHKALNDLYIKLGIIILLGMISQAITSVLQIRWMTIVNETVMLWAFGIAWLVKAGMFKKYLK